MEKKARGHLLFHSRCCRTVPTCEVEASATRDIAADRAGWVSETAEARVDLALSKAVCNCLNQGRALGFQSIREEAESLYNPRQKMSVEINHTQESLETLYILWLWLKEYGINGMSQEYNTSRSNLMSQIGQHREVQGEVFCSD